MPSRGIYGSLNVITEYTNICAICGRPASEEHHLVYGRGLRPLAEKDGLKVPLCNECHSRIHLGDDANGFNVAGMLSKIVGQLEFELNQVEKGIPRALARENFRKRYGRSYL